MSTVFSFQTQLVSIMDALSRTAVSEIGKLVEIESKMLKIEITRGRNEIASLTEKLQLMEKLLFMAQGSRQDAGSSAWEGSERGGFLTPDPARSLTRNVLHSAETVCTTTGSLSELNSLKHDEEPPIPPLVRSTEKHPEPVVIKEEPPDFGYPLHRQDQPGENAAPEAYTAMQKNPDVNQGTELTPELQRPLFMNSFVTLGQNSPSEPGGNETCWSSQLALANTTLSDGKSVVTQATPQSLNVIRNLKPHNFRNSSAKKFGCLHCGKNFRCFSQLEIHQRSHTGEKPFRCTLCGKRYAQKGHLYTHQRTHTGEKPYRCPICGKGFIQKCTLDMHQRTHTGEKPFICVQCGKGFTKNCNLKKHLLVHLETCSNIYSRGLDVAGFSGTFTNGAS